MDWRGHLVIFKSDSGKLRISLTMPLDATNDTFVCNGHGPTNPLAVKGINDFDKFPDLLAHLEANGFQLSPGL
jgi:hypothetical protein